LFLLSRDKNPESVRGRSKKGGETRQEVEGVSTQQRRLLMLCRPLSKAGHTGTDIQKAPA
jgi:hypothetical protein